MLLKPIHLAFLSSAVLLFSLKIAVGSFLLSALLCPSWLCIQDGAPGTCWLIALRPSTVITAPSCLSPSVYRITFFLSCAQAIRSYFFLQRKFSNYKIHSYFLRLKKFVTSKRSVHGLSLLQDALVRSAQLGRARGAVNGVVAGGALPPPLETRPYKPGKEKRAIFTW